jgi:hypothetical protein
MRVIPPLAITDRMLTSSTCAEPHATEAAYNQATTYGLGAKVILGSPSSTVTISVAAPGVVTWTGHGLAEATSVVLSTTGAVPGGLTTGRVYFVVNSTANAFQLAETPGGAPIITTGAQSGVHTATAQVHRAYQSLQAGNVGHPPMLEASSAWWMDIGPSNRWAMFDLLRNTRTVQASPLTVVITPGERIDAIAVVGLVADRVSIQVSVTGAPVYSATEDLSTREVLNWYDHFFAPFSTRPSVALFDLPPYTNAVITVTITRASGDVGCGSLLLGRSVYLGATLHDAESDALNFSVITRDDFGNAVLTPRRTVPKSNQTVVCAKSNVNRVRALRDLLNAVPALWSGLDDQESGYFEAVLIVGVYKRFTIALDRPEQATISLELEEV